MKCIYILFLYNIIYAQHDTHKSKKKKKINYYYYTRVLLAVLVFDKSIERCLFTIIVNRDINY